MHVALRHKTGDNLSAVVDSLCTGYPQEIHGCFSMAGARLVGRAIYAFGGHIERELGLTEGGRRGNPRRPRVIDFLVFFPIRNLDKGIAIDGVGDDAALTFELADPARDFHFDIAVIGKKLMRQIARISR